MMASWPRQVEAAAEAHEPHRIAFYLQDLAAAFHALWNKGGDDPGLNSFVMIRRHIQQQDCGWLKLRHW